jgi:predicted negative regulator of RcsB-dependent stress response
MASHLDLEEQEQLAELRHFWNRYGNWISWALIAVLGAYAAWMGWQSWSARQAQQAAVLYDAVERAAMAGDTSMLERASADIEDKFASTTYAQQAALLAARVMQKKKRPDAARKQLSWVIEHGNNEAYQALARLRLAGLLIEDKAYDEARKQLSASMPESFAPLVADRLGDLAMIQGQQAEAGKYYQQAWNSLEANAEYRRLVAVKLAALGLDPEALAAAEAKK